jgi:hypothetical protein
MFIFSFVIDAKKLVSWQLYTSLSTESISRYYGCDTHFDRNPKVQSADREKFAARNSIYAHAQDSALTGHLLQAILKAFVT